MDVRIKKPVVPNIDSVITPDTNIVMRCIECQTFLLPDMIPNVCFRWRESGEVRSLPVLVCPVCYPGEIGSPEYNSGVSNDKITCSYFLTLTRDQYERTRQAEALGLIYDLKTGEMRSNLLVH